MFRTVLRAVSLSLILVTLLIDSMWLGLKLRWLSELGFFNHYGWAQELAKPLMSIIGLAFLLLPHLDYEVSKDTRLRLLIVLSLAITAVYFVLHLQGGVKSNFLMLIQLYADIVVILLCFVTLRLLVASVIVVVFSHQVYEFYLSIVRVFVEPVPPYVMIAQPLTFTSFFISYVCGIRHRKLFIVAMAILALSNTYLTLHATLNLTLVHPLLSAMLATVERMGGPVLIASLRFRKVPLHFSSS